MTGTLPAMRNFAAFMRTPTLSRSIIALLALAIMLLLAVNIAAFVMIKRTEEYNRTAAQIERVRLSGKDVLTLLIDAETGQRGYMLTARPEYLNIHDRALVQLPERLNELEAAMGNDPELKPSLEKVQSLYRQRLELMRSTIDLTRAGRIGEAVGLIRGGQGKALMDQMRIELARIDAVQAARLAERTAQSERAAEITAGVNALAGMLILVLAGISVWLVRRYVEEIRAAQLELDRVNAGLENLVRDRTAALTRANEEIQRFAYIVSHDLRSPLVNVMGYTSELEQVGKILNNQLARFEASNPEAVDPEAIQAVREDVPEAVGFIRASTAKMDRLINAILRLSREGRRDLVPEDLPMTTMVRAMADSVQHPVAAMGGEIVVDELPDFESDRLSVEQIFGNLIDNAVKYHEPGRPLRIRIEGSETGDEVEYRVIDNGRGVSARDHERIFELFRRAGKQDQPGEGLGLAFVRNSARRLGGTIDLVSELGQGSTFHLKFPKRLIVGEEGERL